MNKMIIKDILSEAKYLIIIGKKQKNNKRKTKKTDKRIM